MPLIVSCFTSLRRRILPIISTHSTPVTPASAFRSDKVRGGQFWTPATPRTWSELHACPHSGTGLIDVALIEPGNLWQNGLGENVTGKFRDECLSLEWLRNRTDAKIVIEGWRCH
jgi:hypothetical protein